MRQEWISRAGKTKLQNFHPRQVEAITQIHHIRGNDTQVFGNDRERPIFYFHPAPG